MIGLNPKKTEQIQPVQYDVSILVKGGAAVKTRTSICRLVMDLVEFVYRIDLRRHLNCKS